MTDQNETPAYNSREGHLLYLKLAESIINTNNSEEIALLSVIRLLTTLPEEIGQIVMCPNIDLPMYLNHKNELARMLVLARLRANV